MPRKHCTRHEERGRSHYPDRPGMFGEHAPLARIEGRGGLRERQERRVKDTCDRDHSHNVLDCNGVPWTGAKPSEVGTGRARRAPAESLLHEIFEDGYGL